ncbi:hypothetical protein [Gloeothece verrucosa]|uniref:Uncharacterized protein n=1 Tax=Gloeothece verrucosa (strain PCC 7822) TaxID=497965 RepID=E0UCV2_GLOV7|nr:hypothetical protein [Gloeothece verrucosa]ADN16417.1 hypothetical protein Cyan7822_4507 [Gloeothece verrucosa PCC 7822]
MNNEANKAQYLVEITKEIMEEHEASFAIVPIEYLHLCVSSMLCLCAFEEVPLDTKHGHLIVAQNIAQRLLHVAPELEEVYQELFKDFPKMYHPQRPSLNLG